jgi:hypothetical protein
LNEAFSFCRTINVDADTEAFEVDVLSPRGKSLPFQLEQCPSRLLLLLLLVVVLLATTRKERGRLPNQRNDDDDELSRKR